MNHIIDLKVTRSEAYALMRVVVGRSMDVQDVQSVRSVIDRIARLLTAEPGKPIRYGYG